MKTKTGTDAIPARPRCRSDSVELSAHPAVVSQARLRSRLALRGWGLEEAADAVVQVVSELVGNAVEASREAGLSSGIRVTLTADEEAILIAVWDAVPLLPIPDSPDLDSEHGRGLLLVDALAEWRDVRVIPASCGGGKLVRAKIVLPQPR
ncbi:MAG: ATP-binding protein [Streptosporangiales bacterium]|nr:ATP-binding protein [Streptosporangiales bacterium]